MSMSCECIYLHIYADKRAGGLPVRDLRCQKARRKRYGRGQERRGTLKDRVSIELRPAIVDERSRIGDWEGDTVVSKDHQGVLLTLCQTITFDNGKEFAQHAFMAASLGADVYFAHPYRSWERGLNENINGLLRQYFPKSTNLRKVTQHEVNDAVYELNHRPRKCLQYRTPHEVFMGLEMRSLH